MLRVLISCQTDLIDVNAIFSQTVIPDNEYTQGAVQEIDEGRLLPGAAGFISKYGPQLPLSELSTGCKAAILVPLVHGVLNMSEVGCNALQYVIAHCTDVDILYPHAKEPCLAAVRTMRGPVLWGSILCNTPAELIAAQKSGDVQC